MNVQPCFLRLPKNAFHLALPLGELSAKLTERVSTVLRNDTQVVPYIHLKNIFVGNGLCAVPFCRVFYPQRTGAGLPPLCFFFYSPLRIRDFVI